MPSLKDFISEARKREYSKEELIPELLKKGYSQKEITLAFEGQNNFQDDLQNKKTLSFFEKIGKVFTPSFFQEVREQSILSSFLTFLLVGIVVLILSFLFSLLITSSYGLLRTSYPVSIFSTFSFVGIFILGIASTFIYSGISHFIVYLFKGQGKFIDTYNAITYSLVPFEILSIIPFIGMFSFIYSLVLSTYGLSEYHKISKGKAFTAAFIPVFIVFMVIITMAVILLYSLKGMF